MKRKFTNPGSIGTLRAAAGLSLAFLVHAQSVWAQTPPLVALPINRVNASSTQNAATGSWESTSYFRSETVQATGTAIRSTAGASANTITSITLGNPGSGYQTAPTVTIAAPPAVAGAVQATAVAVLVNGHVDRYTITNPGAGYTSTPAVTVQPPAPGGVGANVHFNNDITVNNIIELNGNRTVGNMVLGDLSSTQVYTIASGTNGSLIFDSDDRAGSANLNKFMGGNDIISAPIVLNDQLNVRHTTARLTLSGKISGGNVLTSYGNGVLAITGNNSLNPSGSLADPPVMPDYTLWLWNKGQGNANAQVELGSTTGNAAGNTIVGNASKGTSGHAVLQLLQGRTNLDQIHDSATLTFDSYAGSGRNNYFKLMGGDETIGRILDLGSLAVIENREGEIVGTAARLTIAGNQDSYVSGFIRDSSGNNLQQADQNGPAGSNALGLTKSGTGTLTLTGGNIIFTGGMTVNAGKVILSNTTNFRSNITNSGTVAFDVPSGTWNFQKTFTDPDGTGPVRVPTQYLSVTGSGSVEKTGAGTLSLINNQTIGGSLTVTNGILNLQGTGSTGTTIGNGLIVAGDSGLNRSVNLLGKISITGGLTATGRFNNNGSAISIRGTVYNTGDQETSTFDNGVATINGPIKLTYMDLRLESNFSVAKVAASGSSSNKITVTNSASIVPGMRVINNGTEIGTVASIDPVTRVVTMNQNVSVSANASLTFSYANNNDGVIAGSPSSLTLVGRPNPIGGAATPGGLYLLNTRYSNNTNRLPDSTPIISKGGLIEFSNDASTGTFSETLGGMTLNQGHLQVVGYQAGSGGTSTLTLTSLTRTPGATIEFAGRDLASGAPTTATDALGTNNRNKIIIGGVVSLDDGIMGGWATANYEFVKYGANGVTRLLDADYSNDVAGNWTRTQNIKAGRGSVSGTQNPSLGSRTAINSLNIQPETSAAAVGRTVTIGTQILSIESGGLLSSHGSHTITGTSGYLTVGTATNTPAELIVTVGTNFNTPGTINALTMNGTSIRDFSADISTSGTVNAGATTITMNTATGGATALLPGMTVSGTNIPAGTTILSVNYATNTITLSNPVSGTINTLTQLNFKGGSVGLTKSGPGVLALATNVDNTFTGATVVNNGILRIRKNTNLGSAPSSFVANHLQINGGTLQFGGDAATTVPATLDYSINDGTRGVAVGEAGGRIEVGYLNPNPYISANAASKVNLVIENKIQADGVLELAVRSNSSATAPPGSPPGVTTVEIRNTLTLGKDATSSNYFGGGIKTEGSYGGDIFINGQNYVNGLFMEGGQVTFAHNNNFSGTIRVLDGTLNLKGSNTYNGTPIFSDIITIGGASVELFSNSSLGSGGFKVSMADGATLGLNGTNQKILSFSDINTASNPYTTNNSAITNFGNTASTLTIDLSVNEIFRGTIRNASAPLNLVKTGPGRLSLNNAESGFTGTVRIEGGTIDITSITTAGGESALGSGDEGLASEIVLAGGTLSFSPARNSLYTNRSFTMGTGANAATLVANGANQAARIIMGLDFTISEGTIFEERFLSQPVGFEGVGARTLTLSGVNTGDNEFHIQLSDNSAAEPTSLLKAGSGTWTMAAPSDYSGTTTVQEGVLAILTNNVAGTSAISTTANKDLDTLTGNIPNGVEISFPRFTDTKMPGGLDSDTRYYVINSTGSSFQISKNRGGTKVDITSVRFDANLTFVPNIQPVASTVADASADTFTGNLPNGTYVTFNTQTQTRPQGSGAVVAAVLPTGINAYETYYVVESNGTNFKVSKTLGGAKFDFTGNANGNIFSNIYYTAYGIGNTSSGINVIGGRLELRDVDYMSPETVNFQGGALSVPAATRARWAGNLDIQSNTTFTVGANSELILDGNLLGNRSITQLGEGTIRLRGESIAPTLPGAPTNEMDNSRRSYTLQAGTLVLDYSVNNNSKLVDVATLVLGGSRRGGILRLQNGSHEEVVNGVSLQAGANKIYRDSGTSSIRLNTISRAEGASLYFDLARIATVDNLNTNNILGGWAVIRDALVQASWTLYGTVTRNFTANPDSDVLSLPTVAPIANDTQNRNIHYLLNGTPVRLTSSGTLPAPLVADKTYYVTSAGTRTFKLAETPNGSPIDIEDTGTVNAANQPHTVSTFTTNPRQGPATLVFSANPDNYPGDKGNNIFRIQIARQASGTAITSTLTGAGTVANPYVYTIKTVPTKSSANDINLFVSSDITILDYFNVTLSGSETVADAGNYAALLGGGSNDSGNQQMGWARNSTNSLDGLVQPTTGYITNVFSRNGNTNVTDSFFRGEGSITNTIRFATNMSTGIDLQSFDESNPGLHTLQTGSILVTPFVGANDSSIYGTGRLTTENEGNLRNFLIHQYNELGDLVIGLPLVDRAPVERYGLLTGGADGTKTLSGISSTAELNVGDPVYGSTSTTVSAAGIPLGAVIASIPDKHTVVLNVATSGGDRRDELMFVSGGIQKRLFASQQGSGTQNRILGVRKEVAGTNPGDPPTTVLSTSDIYIGMPISGPGIPAGTTVSSILNESDIQVSTNHFFNGILSKFLLTPSIGVEKLGAGTLVLSGKNTYSGVTFLADGVLRATTLTDGGVAGSLGTSNNAAANLNINGGVLQYIGESNSTNRLFTVTDFATINIGHEKTTTVFTNTATITNTGTIGATDRLEKTGTGTLEMRGGSNLNEFSIAEGRLRIQTVDTNPAPGTFSQSNFGQNATAVVRLSGGAFEVRGTEEGNISQTFGGQLYVGEGASEVRAVSVLGYDPNNLSAGKIGRSTALNLMGGEEGASVARASGGTVRFVEEALAGGAAANIFLNTFTFDKGLVLPWAVYQAVTPTTVAAGTGINDFASVSLTTSAVTAADQYLLGDRFMNVDRLGTVEPGSTINASEGGQILVDFDDGLTVVAGSNEIKFEAGLSGDMSSLLVDMSVFGAGIPSGTRITTVDIANLKVVLNKAATASSTGTPYSFMKDRVFFGSVTADRSVNTLRYFSDDDSTFTINNGKTLTLTSGAILIGANVHSGNKNILGSGNITSSGAVGNGADLIIHNYNQNGRFTIGANIIDNTVVLVINSGGTGGASVAVGRKTMTTSLMSFATRQLLYPGMIISGPGIPAGTFIVSIDSLREQIIMNNAATADFENASYTFRSSTSFVQSGIGTTSLSGNNVYTGNTFVHGGVLRVDSVNAVPGGITSAAPLATSSHIVVKDGVLGLGISDFSRSLGTAGNQIEFKGSGGFAAYGADRLVNFGGEGDRIRFGNNGFVADGSSLILGAHDATHKVTIVNPIDLGSFSQVVRVNNGPADIEGELGGSLHGAGKLIKFGLGSLRLSAQNKHTGGIEIAEGRLVAANVPDVFGSSGLVGLGISPTNTAKGSAVELSLEGGNVSNNLKIGAVNSRTDGWVPKGAADISANTGSHASMAVVNGNPAIAYYDAANEDLKYIRAADARGTSWLPVVTLASRGNVGQYPSLTIINGNPAVSYYDATNGTLCYIRSTDASGVFWSPSLIADANPVNAIGAQSDGNVIIGGTFTEFDGIVKTRLARLSSTGFLDTGFTATANGEIRAIEVQTDNKIIIAGAFTQVNGTTRNNIARLNADGTLDGTYNPNANGAIRTLLLLADGEVLVGGAFTNIGGAGRSRLARLTTAGAATSFNVSADNEVFAVAVNAAGEVFLGGSFTVVNSNSRNRIAKVDSAGVLQAFNPNANSDVRGIVPAPDGKVYIGGLFSTLGSFTRNRLARLNADGTLDRDYGVEVNAEVRGMEALSTGKILVRGIFTGVGDAAINSLVCLNTDGSVDTAFQANPDYEVRALYEQADGKLLFGGVFSNIGGATQHWVGRLNANGSNDASFIRKVDDRGQYTSMISVGGTPAIAYHDVAKLDLRYIRSTDVNGAAGTWAQSLALDPAGDAGRGISMKVANIGGDLISKDLAANNAFLAGIATNGTPAIAYYSAESGGQLRYILANTAIGSDWSSPVVIKTADVGIHLSLELINGFPAIAYYSAGSLFYIRANNAAGLVHNLRTSEGVQVTRSLNLLEFRRNQFEEIDPAQPAVWGSGGTGGAEGVPVTLDTGNVGQFPSLAVVNGQPATTLGTPAVAYYDVGNQDLKYIRATDSDGASWPATKVTVQSEGNVGRNAMLVMTDGVPGIGYQDVTLGNVKFVHLNDASGYSKVAFTGDTTWSGSMNLDGNVLFAPAAGQTATITGAITGPGGFRLISEGTLLINSSGNNFGSATGSNQTAPVVIRSGNLHLGSSTALGTTGTVALGDKSGNAPLIVQRATSGQSILRSSGRFDATHNGLFGNAGGPGAFVEVGRTIDGYYYSEGDVGTMILVKDENDHPEWNGVYQIIFNAGAQPDDTLNLVRVASMDAVTEFAYGTQVQVTAGTYAGKAFFLASNISDLNVSPVHWVEDALNGSLALRANVSGLTIANAIDVYSRAGSGSMTLGAVDSVTTGTINFTGVITNKNGAQTLNLSSSIASGSGVTFSGNISQTGGALKLVKTGLGVATLSGTNTTTGGVDVNQGTLLVMGSSTGSGTVTVNASAVLGGTGTIGGSVVLTGTGSSAETRAILRPGDPNSATQAEEKLTINGTVQVGVNAVIEFTLGANNYTKLAANAIQVTPTGRLLVALAAGYVPNVGAEFDILDLATANSLSFTAGNVLLSEYLKLPGQYSWDTSLFLSQGKIKITGNTDAVQIVSVVAIPASAAVNPGENASFTVTVSGTPDYLYQWQKSFAGGPFENIGPEIRSSSTSNTLTLTNVTQADEARYQVVVKNGEGAFTAAIAANQIVNFVVNDPPTIVASPESVTTNPDLDVSFTVTATGPGNFIYQWRRGLTNIIPSPDGSKYVVSSPAPGQSTLTIKDVKESDQAENYNVVVSNEIGSSPPSAFAALSVNDKVVITVPPASILVSTGDPAIFNVQVSGTATPAAPFTYKWEKKDPGSSTFSEVTDADGIGSRLTLPNATLAQSGTEVRVTVNNIVGISAESAVAVMTVQDGAPSFLENPVSQTIAAGTTLELSVKIGGAQTGRVIQWTRNGKAVALGTFVSGGISTKISVSEVLDGTAVTSTLKLENISTAFAGDFIATAKNVNVTKPQSSGKAGVTVASNPFTTLPVKAGANAALTVTAVGPKGTVIGYKWYKDGALLTEDPLATKGVGLKTLTLVKTDTADTGTYTCVVTGSGDVDHNTATAGTHYVKVYTAPPALITPIQAFPPAMVGAQFDYDIQFDTAPEKAPTAITASGLPAGLKVLKVGAGWKISGIPTAHNAKDTFKDYPVKFTAVNGFGKDMTVTVKVGVEPNPADLPKLDPILKLRNVPVGIVGVYSGWLPRHELNGNLGGRIDLTTAVTGAFSGKITLGTLVHAFKGSLTIDPALSDAESPKATVTIVRTGKPVAPPPLTLSFTLNATTDLLTDATLTDGLVSSPIAFNGWRNRWSKLVPATVYMNNQGNTEPKDDKPGYYTMALQPPSGPLDLADNLPQGDSYAYFNVAVDGKLSLVGKTADGQAITGAQFVGPTGQIMMFQTLYKTTPRGSIVGQINLHKNDDAQFSDNSINSTVGTAPTWSCPPNLAVANRQYRNGFGPISLTATGGAYVDPTPTQSLILGLSAGTDNADLTFYLDGLGVKFGDPSIPYMGDPDKTSDDSTDAIDVGALNKLTVPVTPTLTKLAVVAKTGLFSGSFTSKERDEVYGAGVPKEVKRTATFQGILVNTELGQKGMGYFLMPKYPTPAEPTVLKTQIISNEVLLEAR